MACERLTADGPCLILIALFVTLKFAALYNRNAVLAMVKGSEVRATILCRGGGGRLLDFLKKISIA